MQTKINWFEIPSTDFSRAISFYERIFDTKLRMEQFGEVPMGIFTAHDGDGVGCVVHGEHFIPNENGPILYLDADSGLDKILARIESAGGRILMEKMALPRNLGYIAHFMDTEGNRLALHAEQ
ncbi:VOC family protein [Noviherbaspirillum autotrophicum]|uniref:Glyoxalase n=1 Tax=Noviherbaspirillum autotrophicum TaxID=709839 RepID=A0A0C1Y9U7_9BURK|nr:VOC family protein [Noviherbaspirillum autotrophicum]KIF83753.1 glyoxalase [Noviherbaspirillum autotrophicum]